MTTAAFVLVGFVRPSGHVVCGQGCAEPTTPTELLVAKGAASGPFCLLLGASYSGTARVLVLGERDTAHFKREALRAAGAYIADSVLQLAEFCLSVLAGSPIGKGRAA
jgi:hypothetical protein